MRSGYPNLIRRFRAACFALLLLLPLAQLAAFSHLLSHVHQDHADTTTVVHDEPASHAYHCVVCLSAEAILGSAPLVQVVTHAFAFTPFDVTPPPRQRVLALLPPRHYQSRAPPLLLI